MVSALQDPDLAHHVVEPHPRAVDVVAGDEAGFDRPTDRLLELALQVAFEVLAVPLAVLDRPLAGLGVLLQDPVGNGDSERDVPAFLPLDTVELVEIPRLAPAQLVK